MLLYLTSNQKSGLIDGAAHEMLMPSKKLVGKFTRLRERINEMETMEQLEEIICMKSPDPA